MPKSSTTGLRTIRLQGIGHHPAVEAQELKPGEILMWNQGAKTTVLAVEVASPKFLRVTEKAHDSGEVTTRRLMKTRLVARVTKPLSYSVGAAVAASGLDLGDVVEYDERTVQGPDGPETVPAGRGPLRDAWLGGGEVVARVEREDGITDAPPLDILGPAAGRTDEAPAASGVPARRQDRPAGGERVLQEVQEYIKDAPGIGAHAAAAATSAIGEQVQAGRIARDRYTNALPALTAAITAKVVRELRAQGLTHDQIRMRLERKRAEAQRSGDVGGVTVTDAMLAAHAGIVADEEHRQAAPRPLDA
ncbi:hypothetical protein [Streptomyces diastaticus]|uniref:hypothetical protein n=1 Tax=Streptomyces diastaticus TaxID=1956 RepID=UPI003D178BB0